MEQPTTAVVETTAHSIDELPEWCTRAEAAHCARVSERRVSAAVHRGQLRAAIVDARGTMRIHRTWIRAWFERLADERAYDQGPDQKRAAAADDDRGDLR